MVCMSVWRAAAVVILAWGLVSCGQDKAAQRQKQLLPEPAQKIKVEELRIVGVKQVNEAELMRGLATEEDPGWRASKWVRWAPLLGAKRSYFNDIQWERDKQRIISFYHKKGFYHARITRKSELPGKAPNTMRIQLHVSEGQPTRVKQMRVEGLGPGDPRLDLKRLEEVTGLKRGAVFVERDYLIAKERLQRFFQERAFAYAEITGRALIVKSEHAAELVFYVSPGPRTRIGDVVVCGLDRVARDYVTDAYRVHLKRGTPYNARALSQAQEDIYDLGVFSLVTVQPGFVAGGRTCAEIDRDREGAPGAGEAAEGKNTGKAGAPKTGKQTAARAGALPKLRVNGAVKKGRGPLGVSKLLQQAQDQADKQIGLEPVVTVVIQVKEAKNWSARVGAGFTIETVRQDLHLQGKVTARNVGGWLGKLEWYNSLGYAWVLGLSALADLNVFNADSRQQFSELSSNHGVFFISELRYEQPRIVGTRNKLFSVLRAARDVQQGYTEISPSTAIGLSRKMLDKRLTAEGSFNILASRYTFVDDQQKQIFSTQLGLDATQDNPTQIIEYLEQRVALDYRDNPLNPSRGWQVQASLQEAFKLLPGLQNDAFFIKPQLDAELYIPYQLGTRWVTAVRGNLGSIYNLQSDGRARPVPFKSRLFAGGKGSMRSIGDRQLGFFVSSVDGTSDSFVRPIPIGGISRLELSVEQRARLIPQLFGFGDLWMALFLDSATVIQEQLFFDSKGNTGGVAGASRLRETLLYGVGGGVWWVTPAGPVRIDVAWTVPGIDPSDPRFADPNVRAVVLDWNVFFGIGHSF